MSIFGMIKDAIWGKKAAAPATQQHPAPAAGAAPAQAPAAATAAPAPAPAAVDAGPDAMAQVDVEAVMEERAKMHPGLNWRTSIVDMMKLLELDSSLANRKELAQQLGYGGALDGSAEMNLWLHKAVMNELAKNGGLVPSGMTD